METSGTSGKTKLSSGKVYYKLKLQVKSSFRAEVRKGESETRKLHLTSIGEANYPKSNDVLKSLFPP